MAKQANFEKKSKDNRLVRLLKNIRFPTLKGASLYDFLQVFFKGLVDKVFAMRVGAVSWAFFFSLFPFLLFLFSILPYAPLYHEIRTLLFSEFIPNLLPPRINEEIIDYISNTATGPSGRNLSWLFILLTVVLSSNGLHVMMNGFNVSHFGYATERKGLNNRIIALILTLFFVVFIIMQLILTYYTNFFVRYIEELGSFERVPTVTWVLNFASASVFYFISVCMLYFYGTDVKQKFRSVAPGAFMATVLFFISLLAFQYYVNTLNHYDALYGSVGLVMVVMVFIYINVLLILIGFEFNAGIYKARHKNDGEEQITP